MIIFYKVLALSQGRFDNEAPVFVLHGFCYNLTEGSRLNNKISALW